MSWTLSLRMRLILIILIPLLGISLLIGIWATIDAQSRANDRFDRSLLSAALSVSRDVALSGGDALSPRTNTLLRDTSGGPVFYHVFAPNGVFITGYATPPVPPPNTIRAEDQQTYFDAIYQGSKVRVLRFRDAMQIDGLLGESTITVWQDTKLRNAIVRDLSKRTLGVMSSLVLALALIVWFGVRFGLSPLLDLQSAIAQRSSDDLSPIRRAVPHETKGIVATLNALLGQVSSTLQAKDDFISNAAHQLRNPIAGVLAMSQAVQSSRNLEDMKSRSAELVAAAKHTSVLANKLLAFERAKALRPNGDFNPTDLGPVIANVVSAHQSAARDLNVDLTCQLQSPQIPLNCDPLMMGEALANLIDNALMHGGPGLTKIEVTARASQNTITVQLCDDGQGIADIDFDRALERFSQIDPLGGSGLGLPIAQAVAKQHGGRFTLSDAQPGLCVTMQFDRKP